MPDALVIYASVEGQTERIAQRIGSQLRDLGYRVDVAPAGTDFALSDYAAMIVGASVHYGHHPARLARLLSRQNLSAKRTAFFSVSLGAKERYATRFLRDARWQPQLLAVFPGALKYSKYGPLKRLVVRIFARLGGHDTDASRDYEYTDWDAVDAFAAAFSAALARA